MNTPDADDPMNPEFDDPNYPEDDRRRRVIPDLMKKAYYAGLGALFTTEEGIRKVASEFSLPKEITAFLIQQASNSKDELFRLMSKELRRFLESVNVSGELQKLLTSLSFEIKTEVRFIPNDNAPAGVQPDIKVGKVSVKKAGQDITEELSSPPVTPSDEEPL